MREKTQRFWSTAVPITLGKLDQWCVRAMKSKIEPMEGDAKTLRSSRTTAELGSSDWQAIQWQFEGMNKTS